MIVAIIPARAGSKRLPNKNLRTLDKYSLLEWSILAAQASEKLDRVYVSSDSDQALEIAEKAGCAPIRRHPDACTDDATDRNVILDFFEHVQSNWRQVHLIVYLRPTTPFRPFHCIDDAIDKMIFTTATGLRSVHEMSESAYKCFGMYPGGILHGLFHNDNVDAANDPNHLYPKTYKPNGVVDIMRPQVIMDGGTFGSSVMAYKTKPVIEIDTPFDFRMAQMQRAYELIYPMDVWRSR
jgi:CMP-N,N'-diacetyllegionaminic acid synthase